MSEMKALAAHLRSIGQTVGGPTVKPYKIVTDGKGGAHIKERASGAVIGYVVHNHQAGWHGNLRSADDRWFMLRPTYLPTRTDAAALVYQEWERRTA